MNTSSKTILSLAALLALGCAGDDGKIGAVGENGLDGNDGDDGTTALISTSVEAAGSNCAAGGIRLDSGTDTNNNDTLDTDEITDTQYICNGDDGGAGSDGLQSLIETTPLPVDGVCVFGGIQVDYGIDDDDDGNLAMSEVDGTENLCNACPYNPAVFVKDFEDMGTQIVTSLDLDQVVVSGSADLSITPGSRLGIDGGFSPLIDGGEVVTFTFDQPVYNLEYQVLNTGAGSGRDIEAFDAEGTTLGTNNNTGTGQTDISAAAGEVGILSFTDTATENLHSISRIEFTYCP